jgi:hypothetical protein
LRPLSEVIQAAQPPARVCGQKDASAITVTAKVVPRGWMLVWGFGLPYLFLKGLRIFNPTDNVSVLVYWNYSAPFIPFGIIELIVLVDTFDNFNLSNIVVGRMVGRTFTNKANLATKDLNHNQNY